MSFLGGHLPKSSSEGSNLVQLLPSNSNGTILPFLRPKPQLPRPQSFNLNPLGDHRDGQCQAICDFLRVQTWEVCLTIRNKPFTYKEVEVNLLDGSMWFILRPIGLQQRDPRMELLNELRGVVRDLTKCSDFFCCIWKVFCRRTEFKY